MSILIALAAGFLLDAIVGDPYNIPHPIRAVGSLIAFAEKQARKAKDLKKSGAVLAAAVPLITTAVTVIVLMICYRVHIAVGIIAETVIVCYMLAARCLRDESMKVYDAAAKGDTEGARKAVSMIVGRDTSVLDDKGIIRAAVETVAENTSDGVTAPLFYMAIFGAAGGMLYKTVNTMDSMIGYKNEKYADLGFTAAHLDDIMNFIPSRLTALLMIAAAAVLRLDAKNAYRIWRRDRRNHASPNSAQTESVCAGALHLRLAGDAVYSGKVVKKPYIGDDDRSIEAKDIVRANRLMYMTSVLMLILCCGARAAVLFILAGGIG